MMLTNHARLKDPCSNVLQSAIQNTPEKDDVLGYGIFEQHPRGTCGDYLNLCGNGVVFSPRYASQSELITGPSQHVKFPWSGEARCAPKISTKLNIVLKRA